jgi:hypothetical protein
MADITISWISSKAESNTISKRPAKDAFFRSSRICRVNRRGDAMKTARILLYPGEEQTKIMEKLVGEYCGFLARNIGVDISAEKQEAYPICLCGSSVIQLERDVRRRRYKETKRKVKIQRMYCKWGDDYVLLENKVVLPLGKGSIMEEIAIDCVFRPFQILLLRDKHPPTLTLKRMKNHWFAYLLIDDPP